MNNVSLLIPKNDTKPPEPKNRHWTLISTVAFFGLVTAVLVTFFILRKDPDVAPTALDTGPTVTFQALPAAPVADGVCGFPVAQNADISAVVPADTTWSLAGTMAVPNSPSAGPLKAGGIASCFAHTPGGALFAVSHFIAELADPTLAMSAVIDARMSHSTGYDALVLRAQAWDAQTHQGGITRQIAGFRFQSFDSSVAVIDVVQRNTSGAGAGMMAAISYVLRWENDDWVVVPAIDGADLPSRAVPELTTPYTAFNGA